MSEIYDDPLYCKWHPTVETGLRCYQCDTPICSKCVNRTPVGYICRECLTGRRKRFEQGTASDLVIAAVVALVLGGIAGWICPMSGWPTIILSPVAGALIAEIIWRLVGRRYSERLWQVVAGGIVLSGITYLLSVAAGSALLTAGGFSDYAFSFFALLWSIVHIVLATGSAIARLRLG